MSELHDLDAHAQADLLAAGEVSSVELVRHHLERVERLDPDLGAFVTVTPERALAAASAADAARRGGDVPRLTGVPTAIKDLTATAGVRTTRGSVLHRDDVPDVDAPVVRSMRRAGLVSLGKTNTPELGLTSYTDNDVVGPARTPWDPTRGAGGSSGGAAAAVAARLLPLAHGSDGGGSIRIPSSCCGVVGLKPSRGRVRVGARDGWEDLATDGPIARTVRDAAALLDVMSDPSLPRTLDGLEDAPGRLRVARWVTPYVPDAEASAESVAAWEHASHVLETLGHEVVDVPNPFPAELDAQFSTIWSAAIAMTPLDDEDVLRLRAATRYWLLRGRAVDAPTLAAARTALATTTNEVVGRLAPFDAWLTPTLAMPPQPVGWFTESGDPAEDVRREVRFTPYAAVCNMAGVPAVSLPLHVSPATEKRPALPVGIMLTGRRGEDGLLLRLSAQVEAAAPWSDRRPPVS